MKEREEKEKDEFDLAGCLLKEDTNRFNEAAAAAASTGETEPAAAAAAAAAETGETEPKTIAFANERRFITQGAKPKKKVQLNSRVVVVDADNRRTERPILESRPSANPPPRRSNHHRGRRGRGGKAPPVPRSGG